MLFSKIWVKRVGRPPVRSSGVSRTNTDLSYVITALLINVDNFYMLPILFSKYFMVIFAMLILKQKQYWTQHSDCLQVGQLVINPQQSQHFVFFPPFPGHTVIPISLKHVCLGRQSWSYQTSADDINVCRTLHFHYISLRQSAYSWEQNMNS